MWESLSNAEVSRKEAILKEISDEVHLRSSNVKAKPHEGAGLTLSLG